MDDQYYTPSLEELFVGYELELFEQASSKLIRDVRWHKVTVDVGNSEHGKTVAINRIKGYLKAGHIRTPYLTREQIVASGWELKTEWTSLGSNLVPEDVYIKGNFWIRFYDRDNLHLAPVVVFIAQDPTLLEFTPYPEYFRPLLPCPSINELRFFERLFGIN